MPIIPISSHQDWHAIRGNHIGASEVSALFEHGGDLTPNRLWHEKMGHYHDDGNILMAWGRVMEPIIAALCNEHFGWQMEKADHYLEHPAYPHIGCTPDYYATDENGRRGMVQIKNITHHHERWQKGRVPERVRLQAQQEILLAATCTDVEWYCVVSLHDGNPEDLRQSFMWHDAPTQREIITRCNQFWRMVQENIEPELLPGEAGPHITRMVKQATPGYASINLEHDESVDDLMKSYREAQDVARKAKAHADNLKARIHRLLLTIGTQKNIQRYNGLTSKNHRANLSFSKNGAMRLNVKERTLN